MKKVLLTLAVCLSVILSGCAENSETDITDTESFTKESSHGDSSLTNLMTLDKNALSDYDYTRLKDKNITLNVCNWGEYMAVEQEDYMDVNKEFEKLTGITVNYKTFASNEELYSKIKSGGANYDVIVPSDYMISRMIEDILDKIDFDNIPNFKHINSSLVNPDYDPNNLYSVPYTCLLYTSPSPRD